MKTIWNQGPERINKASKMSTYAPSTVKTPPPYDTATVQINAQTSSNLYPSLHSFVSCAHPLPPQEMNKETVCMQSAAQLSMAWVQEGPRIILKPATMTDIDTICKTLPNPNSSNKFVDVLRSHTRYAQLIGSDYRSILLRVLADDITESSLIAEIPALDLDHDKLDGNGIQRDPHKFWWADPENVTEFFKQVKNFLDARAHVCRDLTHATNTKQNKDETASAFVSRFKRVWEEDAHIPINGEMSSLFINTCLNNMNPDLARLIRVTTTNIMQQTFEDFCKQIRELDASGGFTSFLIKPKQEVMFSAPQQRMTAVSSLTKATQRGGAQYHRRPPLGGPKRSGVCHYCGMTGHWIRECQLNKEHEFTRMPQQANHSQAPLNDRNYADQYQVSWINKKDERNKPKKCIGMPTEQCWSKCTVNDLFFF